MLMFIFLSQEPFEILFYIIIGPFSMHQLEATYPQDDAECAAGELFHRFEVEGWRFAKRFSGISCVSEPWCSDGYWGESMFENLVVKMDIQELTNEWQRFLNFISKIDMFDKSHWKQHPKVPITNFLGDFKEFFQKRMQMSRLWAQRRACVFSIATWRFGVVTTPPGCPVGTEVDGSTVS